MENVTVFVVFIIFIIIYMVLGSIKVKDKGETSKGQIPMPDFEFEKKYEQEFVKKDVSPAHKKRLIENFEKRFSKDKSDVKGKHFTKEREQIFNVHPDSHTHKISNLYMENFSLKKAIVYSEILKRKF